MRGRACMHAYGACAPRVVTCLVPAQTTTRSFCPVSIGHETPTAPTAPTRDAHARMRPRRQRGATLDTVVSVAYTVVSKRGDAPFAEGEYTMARNLTTDATQTNVRPATLARRIMRAVSAALYALSQGRMITYRLDGYLSQRAEDAGEDPSTVVITVTSVREAKDVTTRRTTVYGIATALRPDGEYEYLGLRSYNLYKAARVTAVTLPPHHMEPWREEMERKREREAKLANG